MCKSPAEFLDDVLGFNPPTMNINIPDPPPMPEPPKQFIGSLTRIPEPAQKRQKTAANENIKKRRRRLGGKNLLTIARMGSPLNQPVPPSMMPSGGATGSSLNY